MPVHEFSADQSMAESGGKVLWLWELALPTFVSNILGCHEICFIIWAEGAVNIPDAILPNPQN
jgi:hypothetical protein